MCARAQWPRLVAEAKTLCPGAADADASELVLGALTQVALRPRLVRAEDDLDGVIGQALLRTCMQREKQQLRERGAGDIQLMDVGFLDRPVEPAPSEPPLPQLSAADAVAVLADRIGRRRRRRRAVGSVGAAAVVAAVAALGLSGSGGGHPHQKVARAVASAAPIALPYAPSAVTSGVAAGGGYLWTLEQHPSSERRGSTIVRRNLVTGRPEASYRVPGEDFGIGYGLGRVWAWGVDDFRRNASEVISLDPTTAAVHALRVDHTEAIAGAAFTADYGWFTEPERNLVLQLASRASGAMATKEVPGARNVASVSATSVVVSGTFGFTYQLPAKHLVEPSAAFSTLLSSTPSYGIWIGHDNLLAYQPDLTAPSSVHLRLPLAAGLVTGDPAAGVYVATRSNDPQHYNPYLIYYSPAALKALQPRPTVRLDGHVRVESMVPGQNGGIVFVTSAGAIESWNPTAVG